MSLSCLEKSCSKLETETLGWIIEPQEQWRYWCELLLVQEWMKNFVHGAGGIVV
jgi:hypothetical protein